MQSSQAKLQQAMKDLRTRWGETRLSWDDAMSKRFEEEFMQPAERRFREALAAMEHMNEILNQVEIDCG